MTRREFFEQAAEKAAGGALLPLGLTPGAAPYVGIAPEGSRGSALTDTAGDDTAALFLTSGYAPTDFPALLAAITLSARMRLTGSDRADGYLSEEWSSQPEFLIRDLEAQYGRTSPVLRRAGYALVAPLLVIIPTDDDRILDGLAASRVYAGRRVFASAMRRAHNRVADLYNEAPEGLPLRYFAGAVAAATLSDELFTALTVLSFAESARRAAMGATPVRLKTDATDIAVGRTHLEILRRIAENPLGEIFAA